MRNGGKFLNFFKLESTDEDDLVNTKGYNIRRILILILCLSAFVIVLSIGSTVITFHILKGIQNDDNRFDNRQNKAAGFQKHSQTFNTSINQKKETDCKISGHLRSCNREWVPFGEYCYYFESKKKSWNDAKTDCQTRGGYLVKIENLVENWFIKSIVKDRNIGSVWIGADDLGKEGNITWVADKSLVTDGFDDWAPGEPTNGRGSEHCVNMWKEKSYQWNDNKCSTKMGFICKN